MALTTLTKIGKGITSLFKAKGATHARELSERFTDVVNIKDFGAVGDGVTDDTFAIQNAINSLGVFVFSNLDSQPHHVGGGCVFIPVGVYKVTSTLKIKSSTKFFGAGWSSYLKFEPTEPSALIVADESNTSALNSQTSIKIESLTLLGSYEHNEDNTLYEYGIRISDSRFVEVSSVHVYGFKKGIVFDKVKSPTTTTYWFFNKISMCFVEHCETGLVIENNGVVVEGGEVKNCSGTYSAEFRGAGICVSGATFESSLTDAQIYDSGSGVCYSGCYLEKNNKPMFVIDYKNNSFSNTSINGCHLASNDAALVKLENFFTDTSTAFYGNMFGASLLGNAEKVDTSNLINLGMEMGTYNWFSVGNGCQITRETVQSKILFNDDAIRVTQTDSQSVSVAQFRFTGGQYRGGDVIVSVHNPYDHALRIRCVNDSSSIVNTWGRKIYDLGQGFYVYKIDIPRSWISQGFNIEIGMGLGNISGEYVTISNVSLYKGGIPLIPQPSPSSTLKLASPPSYGSFQEGFIVYNRDVRSVGDIIGWVYIGNQGNTLLWNSIGTVQ